MASYTKINSTHQTLSTTTADTITFVGEPGNGIRVMNRDAATLLYFRTLPTDEVQTITFTSWTGTDQIAFTHDGVESALVTYSADATADIQAALESLPSIGTGNVHVTKTTTAIYFATFRGQLARKDVSAITCTSGTGGATGAVVETVAGGSATAVAAADGTVVVPVSSVVTYYPGHLVTSVSVVGNSNPYSVQLV